MRVPIGFKAAPRMADRAAQAKAAEAEKIHLQPSNFAAPLGNDPKTWRFMDVGFEYCAAASVQTRISLAVPAERGNTQCFQSIL